MDWPHNPPPIRGLMALRAVAENGTFVQAARALGWNQPNLSKHLQALERALGTRLVRRDRSGSELTAKGAQVLDRAVRITDSYAEVAAMAAGRQPDQGWGRGPGPEAGAAPVHLALSPTLGHYWLPAALPALQSALGDTPLGVRILRGREPLRRLARGEADLALVEQPPADDDLAAEPVGRDPLLAACHRDHPWAGHDGLSVDGFLGTRHILREPGCDLREALARGLRRAGLEPPVPEREVGSNAALRHHLADGDHLTVTTPLAMTGDWARDITALPLSDLELERPVWAVKLAARQPTAGVAACLEHLRRHPVGQTGAGDPHGGDRPA